MSSSVRRWCGPWAWAARLAAVLLIAAALGGCGDSYEHLVNEQYMRAQQSVTQLGEYLSQGRIPNANIIRQYADHVARQRPEMKELAEELSKEGTTQGLAYTSLVQRLAEVNKTPKDEKEADAALEELLRIEAAADWTVFNDSLIDPANVLAGLSKGELAPLHVPKSAEGPERGPGEQLVGNPRYGDWRQDSAGNSFWHWYGQYALLQALLGPRIYYGSWYPSRSWSYYGDVGRHYYGTRSDTARWSRASTTYRDATPPKSYGPLRSQRRLSTYGRTSARSPGTALKRASTYSSSSRGSASRSSGFRGK